MTYDEETAASNTQVYLTNIPIVIPLTINLFNLNRGAENHAKSLHFSSVVLFNYLLLEITLVRIMTL